MGGRITRALYKNERQRSSRATSSNRSSLTMSEQIIQISKTFTLVMSGVSSFVLGYLFRPHSLNSLKQLQKYKIQQINEMGYSLITLLGLVLLIFGYLSLKLSIKKQINSVMMTVNRVNNILVKVSLLILLIDLGAWVFSYQMNILFSLGYTLLWIGFTNICLLVFNCVKIVRHRKQCKHNNNKTIKQNKSHIQTQNFNNNQQKCHINRSLFLFLMVFLFQSGVHISESIKSMRITNKIKQVIQGQSRKLANQIIGPILSTLEQLQFQYQQFIIKGQHYEKLTIRLIFISLVFMIVVIIISLQKKSLVYLLFYDKRKSQYQRIYQEQSSSKAQKLDKQSIKQQNIRENNLNIEQTKGFKILLISTLIYIALTWILQYKTQSLQQTYRKQTPYQYIGKYQNLKQIILSLAYILGLSYIVLRTSILLRNYCNKRIKSYKSTQIIVTIYAVIICSILSTLTSSIISFFYQTDNLKQDSILSFNIQKYFNYHLNISQLSLFTVILIYYYIRLTADQLYKYPQTCIQYFLTLSAPILFFIKYFVPFEVLQLIPKYFYSNNLINQGQKNHSTYQTSRIEIIIFTGILFLALLNSSKYKNQFKISQNNSNIVIVDQVLQESDKLLSK